jgi:hypothetical protein
MKKNKGIIITAFIILALFVAIGIYVVYAIGSLMPSREDVWNINNRKILSEWVSPDSLYKIGWYNYDEGALGFTCGNISIVKLNESYPIEGNLIMTDIPITVTWKSNKMVEINKRQENIKGQLRLKMQKYKEIQIQLREKG